MKKKTSTRPMVSMTCNAAEHAFLKLCAESERRTVSNFIRIAIERYLGQEDLQKTAADHYWSEQEQSK